MIRDVYVYPNLFVPSAVIAYVLDEAAILKFTIYSQTELELIREIVFISGNPGGRKGENKIYWDGCDNFGMRVPYANYIAHVFLNNQEIPLEILIQFVPEDPKQKPKPRRLIRV